MKLRIIKKEGDFVPQFFNVKNDYWFEIDSGDLACHHYTMEEAMEVVEDFKKRHPKPEVVWEEEY